MTNRTKDPGDKHPDEWREDLNPDSMAGQNVGLSGTEEVKQSLTAYEIKDVHHQFSGFTDDELKAIPVLAPGTRLKQGAVYVDLQDPNLEEFKARGDMETEEGHYCVPKTEVDYVLWNRITGKDVIPERVDEESE